MQKSFIFFYGTLMRCFGALKAFDPAEKKFEFIGEGFVYGKLYDLGAYPAVILGGETKVFGEIFRVKDLTALAELDFYEGFNPEEIEESLYVRRITQAYLKDRILNCWIYEYNQSLDDARLIESGDYKSWRLQIYEKILEEEPC